jgi:hypothetical protein
MENSYASGGQPRHRRERAPRHPGRAREVLRGRDTPIDAKQIWEKVRRNERELLASDVDHWVRENFTEQQRLVAILDCYQDYRDLKVKTAPEGGLDIRGIINLQTVARGPRRRGTMSAFARYAATIDVEVMDKQELYEAAKARAIEDGYDNVDELLRDRDGEIDVEGCLIMLFGPGQSPPGAEIQQSSAEHLVGTTNETKRRRRRPSVIGTGSEGGERRGEGLDINWRASTRCSPMR